MNIKEYVERGANDTLGGKYALQVNRSKVEDGVKTTELKLFITVGNILLQHMFLMW